MPFISAYRAYLPGDFGGQLIPVIWITTAPDEESDPDIIEGMGSTFWFVDRAGWRVAWRAVRIINRGDRLCRDDFPQNVRLRADISEDHFEIGAA